MNVSTEITYAHIIYGDPEAQGLHKDAEYCEYFDSAKTYNAWNNFYDRIEYLENICDYVNIKPNTQT